MAWYQRNEWGAKAPKKALQSMQLPVSAVFLHHTVTRVSDDSIGDMQRVTNYAAYIDVPYNVVVHPNGDIFTGRYLNGVPALGAHTGGHNARSLGLALIGNYVNSQPSEAAIASLAHVLNSWVAKGYITRTFTFKAHKDAPYATACAGTNLIDQMAKILKDAALPSGSYTPTPVKQVYQPPVSTAPAYPMLLRRGAKGNFVRQFQQRLAERGWRISVDGIFGSQTEAIVRQFQREKGLVVDGLVGKKTWGALWTAPVT